MVSKNTPRYYNSGKYNYSEIKPVGWRYTDPAYEVKLIGWIEEMNGIFIKTNNSSADIISQHVFDNAIFGIQEFYAITLTGLKKIKLDAPLKANSSTDSDKDGLTDWKEVDILNPLVTWKADGTIVLPTILDCINYKSHLTYVEEGLTRFINQNSGNPYPHLAYQKVLPIKSDPKRKDSDWDGLLDSIDHFSSYEELNDSGYFNISDPNPLKKEIIWEWPAYYSDGTTIDRLQSSFREKRTNKQGKVTYHGGIDISPTYGNNSDCSVVAAYDGKVSYMRINSEDAGYYMEIEHNINGVKYISRYLHLEKFENSTLYEEYLNNPDKPYVKAGDVIGIISGTPYGYWAENKKDFVPDTSSDKLRYGKHLHYSLCQGNTAKIIDPLCFDVDLSNELIENPEIMFVKIPKNVKPTCSDKCTSCKTYFEKVADNYNFEDRSWGV